jgi:hypothetical protein
MMFRNASQVFLAPLAVMDLKPPHLVIALRNANSPCLSAYGMFLQPTPRLHLRHPSSQFDPRAHVPPSGLYNQVLPPGGIIHHTKSFRARNPSLLRAPLVF